MTAFKLKGMDERYEPFRPVAVASRTRTLDARVHETTDEFRKRAIMVLNNETTMMKTERPDNPIRASINFDPARKSRSCTIVVDALPARLRGGG